VSRPRTVDQHPKREAIIKALIGGRQSLSQVGRRYGIAKQTLSDYMRARLLPKVAAQMAATDVRDAQSVLAKVQETMQFIDRLVASCDEWLRDPENPERYSLDPRDWEIKVIYNRVIGEDKKGNPITAKSKALLSALLKQTGEDVLYVEHRVTDPRDLLRTAALAAASLTEQIAKVLGLIKEVRISIVNIKEWTMIKALVLDATKDAPDARKRIIDGFRAILSE
jgi:hypothetical protein